MLKAELVEAICPSLSPLLKNTIRNKILKHQSLPETYSFGEALLFWLGDLLIGTKLVSSDQLREILEEFVGRLKHFGDELQTIWLTRTPRGLNEYKKLPVCKIGFLDRRLVCMDGQQFFLDLTTGEKVQAADNWPLETLAYNLTTLFVRYNTKMSLNTLKTNSPELGAVNAGH